MKRWLNFPKKLQRVMLIGLKQVPVFGFKLGQV